MRNWTKHLDMTTFESPISKLDLGWKDPFAALNGFTITKIFIGLLIVGLLVSGTLLYIGITSFEKYGGDPQKRGLFNQVSLKKWNHFARIFLLFLPQIHSQICIHAVIYYWFMLPMTFWRFTSGPILQTNILWLRSFVFCTHTHLMFTYFAEYLLLKYFAIVIKKRVLEILDEFWSIFVLFFNLLLAIILTTLECYSNSLFEFDFGFMRYQGLPVFVAKTTVLNYK